MGIFMMEPRGFPHGGVERSHSESLIDTESHYQLDPVDSNKCFKQVF